MELLVGISIFVMLWVAGIILSVLISSFTCGKQSFADSTPEGFAWSLPIFIVYFLLNAKFGESGYPSSLILPIFSVPMQSISIQSDFLGQIYAMLLITCIVTTRMFHTTNVIVCIPSKDELKQFEKTLAEDLKKKEQSKENTPSK
jgi:hypothetical protein